MKQPLKIIMATCLLAISSSALADMFVDRSIVIFDSNSPPREDVKVLNNGDEMIYVELEVLKIENPGTAEEERLSLKNPREMGLMATPNRLAIPPNGQKLVRLVNLNRGSDSERIYRINVKPIVPPMEEDVSQLRIVVAYQILTIVHPKNAKAELQATRQGRVLRFQNSGNSNILLSEGQQCAPDMSEVCQELSSHRLYAGNNWEITLPYDGPVSYSVSSVDGNKKEVFP